ncbi:hypothetical protein WG66_014064 [Moniliophthora roreri]|nr:hypothetical protein WG66_014064 [Moniliophthora roreri]
MVQAFQGELPYAFSRSGGVDKHSTQEKSILCGVDRKRHKFNRIVAGIGRNYGGKAQPTILRDEDQDYIQI